MLAHFCWSQREFLHVRLAETHVSNVEPPSWWCRGDRRHHHHEARNGTLCGGRSGAVLRRAVPRTARMKVGWRVRKASVCMARKKRSASGPHCAGASPACCRALINEGTPTLARLLEPVGPITQWQTLSVEATRRRREVLAEPDLEYLRTSTPDRQRCGSAGSARSIAIVSNPSASCLEPTTKAPSYHGTMVGSFDRTSLLDVKPEEPYCPS